MKLDYINDINEYGDDIVRLYDFDRSASIKFRQLIQEFLDSGSMQLDLSNVEFIESRNCFLMLRISDENEGIISDDGLHFICNLTRKGYEKIVFLLEPFCKRDTSGYQFLYDIDSPTDFLFSPGGSW